MIEYDGLLWPDDDEACRHAVHLEREPSIAWMRSHLPGRSLCIQAGGNVGAYPLRLAEIFDNVLTFEPNEDNFACLKKNTETAFNIRRIRGALGESFGSCHSVEIEANNCGAHQIQPGGETHLFTIDMFATPLDLIWLDVEGCELQALRGARETLTRWHPMVITEEKGIGRAFGYEDHEIGDYLSQFGYRQVSSFSNDRLYL